MSCCLHLWQTGEGNKLRKPKTGKKEESSFWLVMLNLLLIMGIILFVSIYSVQVRRKEEKAALDAFESTIESLQQVSVNYLDIERTYARDWAAYIEAKNMTEDEALDYIRTTSTQTDRSVNFVDMETFEARSSFLREDGSDSVSAYQEFKNATDPTGKRFTETMYRMYDGQAGVIGRYRIKESQFMVISVGTAVQLRQPDGSSKGYLLLRVIPVESMRKVWIFPMEYSEAEIGLITTGCDYVIPSRSMRSENFLEFIRSYNYQNDYNGADELLDILDSNTSGMLNYKNSRGESCYWYYTRLQGYQGIDIVGCIPASRLNVPDTDWSVVLVVAGALLLLAGLDGAHILGINRRLRATAELAEQASEAKTQFLSSMSHDIRTPLNAVLGMTELAKKRADEPEYVRECLDKITASGNHLLTLVNDVLEISKIESGKLVITPEPFELNEFVSSMESIVRIQAGLRGVQFTLDAHDLTVPCLMGDKLRLSQIYLNLLTNAVKYTPSGGRVELEVWEEPAGETVRLCCRIADNGMGMSEEFQKNMYDSFSRATDSRIDKIQGSGLGLAIAKRLLERMNGEIQCQSALGKGTTFTVTVPLPAAEPGAEALQAAAPGQEADGPALDTLHLLVAEDNDLNWEITSAMLESEGIRSTRAEDGRKCVEMLEASAPGTYDMVLMDVQMPNLNGCDATRLLRSSEREDLRHIPIAAMTANAFAEDVKACLEAGMDAHLAKPIEIKKVLTVIRQLCRRKPE